jgi:hypothetical protein
LFQQSETAARNLEQLKSAKRKLEEEMSSQIKMLESELSDSKESAQAERSRLMKRISEVESDNAEELKRLSEKGAGDSTLHAEALEMMRKVLTQEKESAIESLRVEMRDEHSQYLKKEEHEISAIQRIRSNHASELETLTQKHMRDERSELSKREKSEMFAIQQIQANHTSEMKMLTQKHSQELERNQRETLSQLEGLRSAHTSKLQDLTSKHQKELEVENKLKDEITVRGVP